MKQSKSSSDPTKIRKSTKIVLAVVGALLLLVAVYIASLPKPATPEMKAQQQVEREMSQINLSFGPAYAGNYGDCYQEQRIVAIRSEVYCAYISEKFYKGKGQLNEDLQRMDRVLRAAGWHGYLTPQAERQGDRYSVDYNDPARPKLHIRLTYFSNTVEPAGWNNVQQRAKANIHLANDEYAYGVYVYSAYQP